MSQKVNTKLIIDEYHQKYKKYHYPLLRKNPDMFVKKLAKKLFGYIPKYKLILPKLNNWEDINYYDYGEIIYYINTNKEKRIIEKYANRLANEYYFLKYE